MNGVSRYAPRSKQRRWKQTFITGSRDKSVVIFYSLLHQLCRLSLQAGVRNKSNQLLLTVRDQQLVKVAHKWVLFFFLQNEKKKNACTWPLALLQFSSLSYRTQRSNTLSVFSSCWRFPCRVALQWIHTEEALNPEWHKIRVYIKHPRRTKKTKVKDHCECEWRQRDAFADICSIFVNQLLVKSMMSARVCTELFVKWDVSNNDKQSKLQQLRRFYSRELKSSTVREAGFMWAAGCLSRFHVKGSWRMAEGRTVCKVYLPSAAGNTIHL